MEINDLLDKAKTRANLPSDYALAKAINVSRGWISEYRKGKRHPSNEVAVQLATLAGLEEMSVIAAIEYQTATTEKKKEFWKLYMHDHGIAGAFVMVTLGLSLLIAPEATETQVLHCANYDAHFHAQNEAGIYIMRTRKGEKLLILKALLYKVCALFTFAKIHAHIKPAIH
ncbi:MAG: hypothetical protein PHC51_11850 [bacterium]|nr:hypothetical protein [bacterium]